jgi:hypothetical protein
VINEAPVDYVCPYPYSKGAAIVTFKYLCTSGIKGALPDIISLTLPPKAAFVLLKNSLS